LKLFSGVSLFYERDKLPLDATKESEDSLRGHPRTEDVKLTLDLEID
jgi:hypothetical protein